MVGYKKDKFGLTEEELKSSAASKLLGGQVNTLKRSLKKTQDEYEEMRSSFHDKDKKLAVLQDRVKVKPLYEIIKYAISGGVSAYGINLVSDQHYSMGSLFLVISIVIYSFIVYFENK